MARFRGASREELFFFANAFFVALRITYNVKSRFRETTSTNQSSSE